MQVLSSKAPRRPARFWPGLARGGLVGLCLWWGAMASGQGDFLERTGNCRWEVEPLVHAQLAEPTGRYPHAVLGDAIEYGAINFTYMAMGACSIRLPQERVFEDIQTRLVDVDGDKKREVIVVESHKAKGARLAIYNGGGLVTATPYI